jgi:hypothetical protein
MLFEVRYENGASHMVPAETHEEAIKIAVESLKSCMPKGFDFENLVRVTIVRQVGVCAICGKHLKKENSSNIESCVGYSVQVCKEHTFNN